MSIEGRKQAAVEFLRAARRGDRAAVEAAVAPGAKHHNAYFAAGMSALIDAMMAAAKSAGVAHHSIDIRRVIGEGDMVAVHSFVTHPGVAKGISVVHIFRFEGEKIAELWDVGAAVPAEMPNADGMF
jgi:predicted SnoaL-like aldol condensation-catalyzing enzyme